MLNQSHLQHQITEEQLHHFNQLGYLIVKEALPEDLVDRLEKHIDQIYQQHPLYQKWHDYGEKFLLS